MALAAYSHQDVPFEQVVEALNPPRTLSYSPLFQVLLVLQNERSSGLPLPGLSVSAVPVHTQTTQFDLTLTLHEGRDGLRGQFEFATDLFDRSTLGRWANHLCEVLASLARDPQQRLSTVTLLSAEDRQQILHRFNATQVDAPREELIQELFAAQVAKTPEAIAVQFEEHSLSYLELHVRSNQVAHYLRARGVGPDKCVGLCMPRSLEMIVGLLGILKAGGAYVPLDPGYPAERLAYLREDAAPIALLTEDLDQWTEISQHPHSDLSSQALGLTSSHLAYVIYTSGSTGTPKGVMVEHRAVVNLLNAMRREPGISAADRVLAATSLSFDIASLEIWLPLLNGARLVLVSRETASSPARLTAIVEEVGITLMQATPAVWQLLFQEGWSGGLQLRALCGGEALSPALAKQLRQQLSAVWNVYGPTETTIWSTCRRLQDEPDSSHGSESIGRPIDNTQVYILDLRGEPVPIGVTGEIYIGGAGLARGYLRQPDLTAQRFIDNPFAPSLSERLYATGDLGRWAADGNIEFLGRNDHQVKIRGHRIELGEIEAQLLQQGPIREAIVAAVEDTAGEKHLVAYVVAQEALNEEALRNFLSQRLPDYMIPARYMQLSALPLTSHGKVNRKALPLPDTESEMSRVYQPPQGILEATLAEIWQQLLNVSRVGRQHNFFELGGHSLLAIRVTSQIRERLGVDVELRALFEAPTLAELAECVEALQYKAVPETAGLNEMDETLYEEGFI
jgi:amino acid adenylation domain-containing protein